MARAHKTLRCRGGHGCRGGKAGRMHMRRVRRWRTGGTRRRRMWRMAARPTSSRTRRPRETSARPTRASRWRVRSLGAAAARGRARTSLAPRTGDRRRRYAPRCSTSPSGASRSVVTGCRSATSSAAAHPAARRQSSTRGLREAGKRRALRGGGAQRWQGWRRWALAPAWRSQGRPTSRSGRHDSRRGARPCSTARGARSEDESRGGQRGREGRPRSLSPAVASEERAMRAGAMPPRVG